MIRIYEVRTERPTTSAGHTYDRFNVSAENFAEAYTKAKKAIAKYPGTKEQVKDIHVLAEADVE